MRERRPRNYERYLKEREKRFRKRRQPKPAPAASDAPRAEDQAGA